MRKKAQSMPMNVVIVAALALMVLIILMVIFGGRIKIFSSGLGTCDGVCVTDSSKCAEGTAPMPTKNCDQNADGTPEIKGDAVCCKAVS